MRQSIIIFLLILIPVLALAQTAEEYFDKGLAKYNLGDYRGALQDFNKAIELDPNDANAYYNRSSAKIRLGQKDSGCLDLSKAGELGDMQVYDVIKKYCQ